MKSWCLWLNMIPIKGWTYLVPYQVPSTIPPEPEEPWHTVTISHLSSAEDKLCSVILSRSVTRWHHKMIYCSILCIYEKHPSIKSSVERISEESNEDKFRVGWGGSFATLFFYSIISVYLTLPGDQMAPSSHPALCRPRSSITLKNGNTWSPTKFGMFRHDPLFGVRYP